MDDNKKNKINIGSSIAIVLGIIAIVFVGTYAWLSWRSQNTAMVLTIGDINNVKVTLTPYQFNSTIKPIDEEDYSSEKYTSISAINNSSTARNVRFYYHINTIDDELKITSFKYTMERSIDNGNSYSVYALGSGNFSTASNNNDLDILTDTIPAGGKYKYKVYIWLDTNGGNQTEASGKRLDCELRASIAEGQYQVTFDANGGELYTNLIYGLDNAEEHTNNYINYSISNGVIIVTALRDDGWGNTTGRIDLEAGKTYIFNCTIENNIIWRPFDANNGDNVGGYICLGGSCSTGNYIELSSNNNFEFTPTVSGTYWLRLDVNQNGKTHTFSNISIVEKNTEPKLVNVGDTYGTLPTPTKTGYTFLGWNGKNLYNVNSKANVTSGVTVDDNDWITINTANGTRYYNYFTHNLDVLENTQYTLVTEISNVSNITGYLNVVSTLDNAGISQFYGKTYTNSELINNSTYVYTLTSRTNVSLDVGLRTFYNNLNYDTSGILTFRLSVMNKDTSITSSNFEYEPYYITSSTTVVQDKNHTLTAIWQKNN